jgi:redox-sensing transcriptional repressor
MRQLRKKNLKWISSHRIAKHLGLTSVTVRQDLTYLDFYGVGKRGYLTAGLEKTLSEFFSTHTENRMAVVGAGNIGQALVRYEEFSKRGFNICGLFDSDENKIGTQVEDLTVQAIDDLPNVIRKENIKIGIIAVPPEVAQSVADQLILSGIQGLLNLSTIHIITPKSLPIVEVRIVNSLRELVYKMNS